MTCYTDDPHTHVNAIVHADGTVQPGCTSPPWGPRPQGGVVHDISGPYAHEIGASLLASLGETRHQDPGPASTVAADFTRAQQRSVFDDVGPPPNRAARRAIARRKQ
jgi:hypothetical protein